MALFGRRKRGDEPAMRDLAEELGLTYAGDVRDTSWQEEIGTLPDLPLFSQGNPKSVKNLMYGALEGVAVQLFNYDLLTYADDPGGTHRSCVLFTLDEVFPELWILPKGGLPRLSEKIHEMPLSFGLPELHQRFRVQAKARSSAEELIGADLQRWLVDCPVERLCIEMEGDALLGHAPDLPGADEFRPLLDFMQGFRLRIPTEAMEKYRPFS